MSHELCDMGSSTLDAGTNALLVQCKGEPVGEDENQAPDYGDTPIMCALGVSARPFPADANGSAQAVVATDIPGSDGIVVAARDTRTADVYAELSPGDTALHGTGPEHKSQVRCQKHMVSIITVDADDFNALFVIDGDKRKIQISGFGHIVEMSKDNGIALAEEGGAALTLKDGAAVLKAGSLALGENATVPVAIVGPGGVALPCLSILVPAG